MLFQRHTDITLRLFYFFAPGCWNVTHCEAWTIWSPIFIRSTYLIESRNPQCETKSITERETESQRHSVWCRGHSAGQWQRRAWNLGLSVWQMTSVRAHVPERAKVKASGNPHARRSPLPAARPVHHRAPQPPDAPSVRPSEHVDLAQGCQGASWCSGGV